MLHGPTCSEMDHLNLSTSAKPTMIKLQTLLINLVDAGVCLFS